MLELFLALIGGLEMILGGLAWRQKWCARKWSWLFVGAGVITFLGGTQVWDYEERRDTWHLSTKQQKALMLQADTQDRAPIVFFAINAQPLSQTYAYEIMAPFIKRGWDYAFVYPNWVDPNKAHGLEIRTCDKVPNKEDITRRIDTHKRRIKGVFRKSKIALRDDGGTEQYLSGTVIGYSIIEDTKLERCTMGLVIGQPPEPCERMNISAEWLPNLWCKMIHGTW